MVQEQKSTAARIATPPFVCRMENVERALIQFGVGGGGGGGPVRAEGKERFAPPPSLSSSLAVPFFMHKHTHMWEKGEKERSRCCQRGRRKRALLSQQEEEEERVFPFLLPFHTVCSRVAVPARREGRSSSSSSSSSTGGRGVCSAPSPSLPFPPPPPIALPLCLDEGKSRWRS